MVSFHLCNLTSNLCPSPTSHFPYPGSSRYNMRFTYNLIFVES
jgi:hypothetical protein